MPLAPLARVVRSGFTEGLHFGSAVALDPAGRVVVSIGEPEAPMLPRSALKPLQLVAMLGAGLRVGEEPGDDGRLLALAEASHSGEPFHLDGVRAMLAAAGLTEADLGNTPDLPLDPATRQDWLCAARPAAALAQNCSGKHAAMLATCVANGWPLEGYREPAHPLQQRVVAAVEELAGEPVAAVTVDGCGAPALAISLTGLARSFATLARAEPKTPAGQAAGAIRTRPEWLGGTGREVTRLIRAVPGLIAKDGAEAVYAAALPDGRVAAVKVADGGDRARLVVLRALLSRLGVPADQLATLSGPVILGHGEPVGAVLPVDF
jgi:L-asparaginase II